MRYTVESNFVDVLGHIWQPGVGLCHYRYNLTPSDVEQIGEFTRENVRTWLNSHAGDFSEIVDFQATIGEDWIHFEQSKNESLFVELVSGEKE